MTKDFDPKLREAVSKVEAIAKEYDCAYLIVFSNQTHTEFKADFPPWSLIQYKKNGIRVKTNRKNPELTNSSLHLLYSIRDVAGLIFLQLEKVTKSVEKLTKVEHIPFNGKKWL